MTKEVQTERRHAGSWDRLLVQTQAQNSRDLRPTVWPCLRRPRRCVTGASLCGASLRLLVRPAISTRRATPGRRPHPVKLGHGAAPQVLETSHRQECIVLDLVVQCIQSVRSATEGAEGGFGTHICDVEVDVELGIVQAVVVAGDDRQRLRVHAADCRSSPHTLPRPLSSRPTARASGGQADLPGPRGAVRDAGPNGPLSDPGRMSRHRRPTGGTDGP